MIGRGHDGWGGEKEAGEKKRIWWGRENVVEYGRRKGERL